MELVRLTHENLVNEHICCAISSEKDIQVRSKKGWLADRLDEGLVFLKGDVRGKCFIEYIPAENAWVPVEAPGYMFINCFWVSGQFKGQGNADILLNECIAESKAKGRAGLCVISSKKKMAFLSDPGYLAHRGFIVADTAEPSFVLMYLPFDGNTVIPKFSECAKKPQIDENGFVLYYSHQCPFTAKYVPLIEEQANSKGIPFKSILIQSREEAQKMPVAVTSYALFYNGKYISNEILSEKKFEKLASELCK